MLSAAAQGGALESELRRTEMHYIGLDVHKQSVSYCTKTAAGEWVEEGRLDATREDAADRRVRRRGALNRRAEGGRGRGRRRSRDTNRAFQE